MTVILTTHNLAEVEELCSRIILIDHGRVLYDGGLSEFKWRHAPGRTLVVELVREMPAHPIAGTETIRQDGRTLLIRFPRGRAPAELIREVTARYDVRDLTLREPSLEDVLRDIYQQPSRLRAAAVP